MNRPSRIAVISSYLPVGGKKAGGVAQVAHDLAHGLARRGYEIVVWSYDGKPDGAAYEVRMLPWRRFATSRSGRFLTEGYLGNFLSVLPKYDDAEVVIAMGDSLLLPALGKPIIRVMHGSALGEALSAKTVRRFVSQLGIYLQELFTAITQKGCVGVSHSTRRYNPFVRRVIPNGVDLKTFFPDPTSKTPEPSILFVGTVKGRKRGHLLLERFEKEVRTRHPTATLVMVSPRGPEIEGVTYRTGVGPEELATLYRRAWVYASPSSYEGFGLPYLEAMASGTPVIATPNPGSQEVLGDGRFGLLVPDADFGTALSDLLADHSARDELATRGLERARDYDLSTMLDAYEELLTVVCNKPGIADERV